MPKYTHGNTHIKTAATIQDRKAVVENWNAQMQRSNYRRFQNENQFHRQPYIETNTMCEPNNRVTGVYFPQHYSTSPTMPQQFQNGIYGGNERLNYSLLQQQLPYKSDVDSEFLRYRIRQRKRNWISGYSYFLMQNCQIEKMDLCSDMSTSSTAHSSIVFNPDSNDLSSCNRDEEWLYGSERKRLKNTPQSVPSSSRDHDMASGRPTWRLSTSNRFCEQCAQHLSILNDSMLCDLNTQQLVVGHVTEKNKPCKTCMSQANVKNNSSDEYVRNSGYTSKSTPTLSSSSKHKRNINHVNSANAGKTCPNCVNKDDTLTEVHPSSSYTLNYSHYYKKSDHKVTMAEDKQKPNKRPPPENWKITDRKRMTKKHKTRLNTCWFLDNKCCKVNERGCPVPSSDSDEVGCFGCCKKRKTSNTEYRLAPMPDFTEKKMIDHTSTESLVVDASTDEIPCIPNCTVTEQQECDRIIFLVVEEPACHPGCCHLIYRQCVLHGTTVPANQHTAQRNCPPPPPVYQVLGRCNASKCELRQDPLKFMENDRRPEVLYIPKCNYLKTVFGSTRGKRKQQLKKEDLSCYCGGGCGSSPPLAKENCASCNGRPLMEENYQVCYSPFTMKHGNLVAPIDPLLLRSMEGNCNKNRLNTEYSKTQLKCMFFNLRQNREILLTNTHSANTSKANSYPGITDEKLWRNCKKRKLPTDE